MDIVEPKDKEDRRVKAAKIALMRNPQFCRWSGIMMLGRTIITDEIPTAATNGRDEWYGREFIKLLDDKGLRFAILHENSHKLYRDLTLWEKLYKEDPKLANMACDYVHNLKLHDLDPNETFIAMPRIDGKPIGLLDERFRGMHHKQVFDILKEEGEGQGQGGQGQPGEGQPGEGSMDHHDWEGAQGLTPQEKETLAKDIDRAIRQGQALHNKMAGKGAGNSDRGFGELLEPKVNWKEQLREFAQSSVTAQDEATWAKPNRRHLWDDVYLPTLIGNRVREVVIGVDTSGSIGGPDLNAFLSEAQGVCRLVKPELLHLIYWDTAVAGHETYTEATLETLAASTKPRGGGGTDPTCMMAYMKEKRIKPECIIMLTDGYISNWGSEWGVPILWVIVDNPGATAPIGKTIHMEKS